MTASQTSRLLENAGPQVVHSKHSSQYNRGLLAYERQLFRTGLAGSLSPIGPLSTDDGTDIFLRPPPLFIDIRGNMFNRGALAIGHLRSDAVNGSPRCQLQIAHLTTTTTGPLNTGE